MVLKCELEVVKQGKVWQVELASGSRIPTNSLVQPCELELGGFITSVDLQVIPLGSYDIVSSMDWIGSHRASIDSRRNTIQCKGDQGKDSEIVGIQRPISLRMIFFMQLKQSICKGF